MIYPMTSTQSYVLVSDDLMNHVFHSPILVILDKDLRETNQLLRLKIAKLEQLLRLKDAKIRRLTEAVEDEGIIP